MVYYLRINMAKKKITIKELLKKHNEIFNVYHEELVRIYEDDEERIKLLNNLAETLNKKYEQINAK